MFRRVIRNNRMKAGVSLVTVLLFMLVATIAATATYKWLTSEGRSSGARLQKQTAYQSSLAGLESARSWMTFNANDVGALIKQYKDTGKKIKLNSRLTPWSKADLNYDVWLVGVNTGSAHNFKLKVLSSGRANGGAVHNEVAIFNVDGLYQVQIPEEETEGTTFDKAFDGKMTGVTGNDTLQSGIIHGDFIEQNNTPKLSGNFVIAGDMGFGGHVHGNGDMYVKGSVTSKNGGYTFGNDLKTTGWMGWGVVDAPDTNVVYIGGDVDCADNQPIRVYGDLYVGGSIKERCAIEVTGNLTIGKSIERTSTAAKMFTIGKNLVFRQGATFHYTTNLEYGTGANASGSGVGVNTYLANLDGKDKNGARKVNFGNKIYLYSDVTGYTHCRNRDKSTDRYRPINCSYCEGFFSTCDGEEKYSKEDDRYFSIKHPLSFGHLSSSYVVDNPKISSWSKNDAVLKDVSDNYWKNIAKMEGYGKIIKNDGTIPQAIILSKDSASWLTEAKAKNAYCGISKDWIFSAPSPGQESAVKKLNDCYKKAQREDKLFHGFLAIEWEYNQDGDPGPEKLDGKFFIYASKAVGNTSLPSTTPNSVVMFYFEKGATGTLKGKHSGHRDWVYNYFFYSNGDINEIWNFNYKGSIIMSNGTTLKKFQGNNKVEYSSTVVNALVTAGIIKENPEFTRLVNGTSSSSSGGGSTTTSVAGTADTYYIGASPQLRITLESQYENNEPLPVGEDEEAIASSFIVLPRIIFLPKNPYGTLADYFNVVPLNGASLNKDVLKVSDCGDIPKQGLLKDAGGGAGLTAGLHVCKYSDLDQTIPFYIYVSEESVGTSPWVQFKDDYQDMGPTATKYVELVCPVETNGGEFTIRVSKTNDLPTSWTINPVATPDGSCEASSPSCVFKLHFNSTDCGSPKRLFEVQTTSASEGTAVFQMNCEAGCLTGTPSSEKFVVSTSVTVNRESLSDYCALSGVTCSSDLLEKASHPDCNVDETGSWVKAVGVGSATTNNCAISETNRSWICGISSAIELQQVDAGVPAGCEVVIPSDETHNKVSSPESDESYTLYASLKAQSFTFTVDFKGENLSGKQIQVTSDRFDSPKTCSYSQAPCQYSLFAGDKITLTVPIADRTNFSYWKCASGTNCESNEAVSGATYTIEALNGENTVEAWFGQKDKHCFFDEFNTFKTCVEHSGTEDKRYCFAYCAGECTIENADKAHTTYDNVMWLVFGSANERNLQLQYANEAVWNNLLAHENGKIWIKDTRTRGKKQSDVEPLRILSTVKAGLYGTLRAQFQVPRMGKGDDESSARVNKSGFILRSNNDASSYLFLNVFANKNSKLAAKACVGEECREELLMAGSSSVTVSSTDVITLSATIKAEGRRDILEIEAVIGNYGTYTTATARIVLSEIDGFTTLTGNAYEYVGFGLSDPAFQLYDIGWKSQSYYSECWATYPTVKCSFRAAYLGGIVPKDKPTKPWVGLSSWFDDKSCTPQYHYNGDDATEGCYGMPEDGYKRCYADNYYKFTTGGLHGTVDEPTGGDATRKVETKMAMARVQECDAAYLSEDDRRLLYAESPRCGQFWVGTLNNCNKNELFFSGSRTITTHTGNTVASEILDDEMFSLGNDVVANLRSAVIKITLDNPDASELEVYLRSQTDPGYYGSVPVFSASAVTTAKNVASISVEDLAGEVGFDPEHVTGVVIRNLGSEPVYIKEIKSACDYVTSIQCKNVEYVSGGGFKVHAVVKRAENVKSYSISATENGQNVSSLSKTFSCPGATCPTGDAEGRIFLMSDVYNPYASSDFNAERSYVFSVSMTDDGGDVEGSPCTTTPVLKLQPISAECKWAGTNTKPSIQQGKGLPDFQYKLPDCAGGNCAWEVSLDGSSSIVTGEGVVAGFTSIPSDKRAEYNTESDKLALNDHKIYIRPTNSSAINFNECYMEFTVTEANNSTGNLTCTMPAEVLPGKQNVNISVYSSLVNQQFDIYVDDSRVKQDVWINNAQQLNVGDLTMPTVVGRHTFKITKKGETEAECAGNFEVSTALECKIKNAVEINVANEFTVSKKSFVNSCWSCTYTGIDCGNQCGSGNLTSYPFTVTNGSEKTLSVTCTCDNISATCSAVAQANIQAPTISCSSTAINAGAKESVSVTPTSLTNCGVGCNYNIVHKGTETGVKTGSSYSSASAVSFTDNTARTGQNTYTFTVSNGDGGTTSGGTASCDFVVDYKDPSVTCTDEYSVEPGASVPFTPTTLNYCGGGCKDTVKIGNTIVTGINTWDYTSPTAVSFPTRRVDNQETDTYVFKVTNQANRSGTCDITVNYLKPTVGCPADMDKAANSTVTVTPTSVSNCTQGCKYKVTKGSAGGSSVISASSYSYTVSAGGTPGSLGSSGFTGEAASSTPVEYFVTLTNPAGASDACSFKVTYKSESEMCHCTCGGNRCSNIELTAAGTNDHNALSHCYFIDDGNVKFRIDDACTSIKINGTAITGTHSETEIKNYGVAATAAPDNGYYLEIIHNGSVDDAHRDYCNYQISHTSATNHCSSGSGSGSGGGGGSGGGSGTDVELSSQGMDSYTKGTYTLKTGSGLGSGPVPRTFKCRTENIRPSTIRVVGTIYLGDEKKYDISISAHNDYSQGYDLNSETTYTFNVDNSIDNLECGLWF